VGEITPLLQAHWEEIAHYKDIELAPNVEAYAKLEAAGILHCYTARVAGALVGYFVTTVVPSLHYRGSLQAHQDVLFVLPEHRKQSRRHRPHPLRRGAVARGGRAGPAPPHEGGARLRTAPRPHGLRVGGKNLREEARSWPLKQSLQLGPPSARPS
jgi:hypothetical protein